MLSNTTPETRIVALVGTRVAIRALMPIVNSYTSLPMFLTPILDSPVLMYKTRVTPEDGHKTCYVHMPRNIL